MKLSYFSEDAYDDLSSNLNKNLLHYMQDEDWLDEYFKGQEYKKDSTIDFSLPSLFQFPNRLTNEEKTKEDIANVKLVYDRLKGLSPLQATNKYMWTCLSHTVYRNYVIHRWIDDDKFQAYDDKKQINRIRRTFFTTGEKRSLEANAIARLWWYGFASYDTNNSANPFHLTDILVANTKFCRDFMQSLCCESHTVGKGVLLAVNDFIQTLGKNEGVSGYYRYLKKYLNRYGAVTAIDFLDEDEVRTLSLDYLNSLRRKQPITEDDSLLDFEEEELELTSIT